MNSDFRWKHPPVSRRMAIQAGAIGILGLGVNHLSSLRHAEACSPQAKLGFGKAKSCIFIFLSGGLAQHESFDMKPNAPENVRGEFKPISTRTPGIQICEHLPLLAERSDRWALCRSLTHSSNDHSAAHHIMLTGQSQLPTGFNPNGSSRTDRPSIASVAGYATKFRNNLPTAVALPERLVHSTGRVIPGQHAGEMGAQHDPWMIEASPFHSSSYGAYPEYGFDHQGPRQCRQSTLPSSANYSARRFGVNGNKRQTPSARYAHETTIRLGSLCRDPIF